VREEVAAVEPGKHEPKLRALVAAVKRLTSKE
jgi:hypothetical protein